jgi:hypothetical protein
MNTATDLQQTKGTAGPVESPDARGDSDSEGGYGGRRGSSDGNRWNVARLNCTSGCNRGRELKIMTLSMRSSYAFLVCGGRGGAGLGLGSNRDGE